jgi:GNAT superfamily N-acetyltransferase
MRIQYREAEASDAERIALLHAKSWQCTYRGVLCDEFLDSDVVQNRLVHWQQRLINPEKNQFVLLVEEGEYVKGFLCVIGEADAQWGALLDNVHVRPEMKGQGLGTELMHKAGEWVQANFPQSGLHLWVFEANYPARRFYERLGATKEHREVGEVTGGGTAPVLRYVWASIAPLLELDKKTYKRPHESVMRSIR